LVTYENSLGAIYLRAGRYPEAEEHFVRAEDLARQHYGPNHPKTGVVLASLGRLAFYQGDHEASEAAFRQAVEIREATHSSADTGLARALNGLAVALFEQQRHEEALAVYERAIAAFVCTVTDPSGC
jgi:tetratricopeptide (TPR) repeat protein